MAQIRLRKFNIKKQPITVWLAYFIFIMPFFLATLQDLLRFPAFVKYTVDVAWVLCTVLVLFKKKLSFDKKLMPFMFLIFGFLLYTLIVYLFNFQSVFYYLWGFRNNFRFYFAFIIFSMLFTEDDANFCIKFMDILFWINVAVSLFQFFVLGLEQDYLGGIFGTGKGCNAYSLVFFTIVLSKSLILFMEKKESAFNCFFKCGLILIIAAMAELKFFFVAFVMVLLLSTMLTSFSWRKFFVIFFSALLLVLASSILSQLFGADGDVSFENLLKLITAENYATEDDLSRFGAIPTISRSIMTNNWQRVFGLGLGNCDTSTFAICNTPFYQVYSYLHYSWFSSAFLFLETGYVGLIVYLTFFVICFIMAGKQKKKAGANTLFCNMAMIMSVLCVTLTFYNASLRVEVAYMVYFVLALPLIDNRSKIRRLNQ